MKNLPATTALDLDLDEGWLTVWFNQPEIRNPLTEARSGDLLNLCAALRERRDIRGVTFRGRGGVFCAGGDLKAFKTIFQGGGDREAVRNMSRAAAALFDAVNVLPQVTVMVIEGAAMAGGFGLACTGDVVIAEKNARFSLTETTIGLSPAQIAPFVVNRLGLRQARRLMLTAATLTGAEAMAVGLADLVAEGSVDIDAAITSIREQVLRCAPGAIADTKRLLLALHGLSRAEQIEMAANSFADRMLSDEGREGVASFTERRKPIWAGTGERGDV